MKNSKAYWLGISACVSNITTIYKAEVHSFRQKGARTQTVRYREFRVYYLQKTNCLHFLHYQVSDAKEKKWRFIYPIGFLWCEKLLFEFLAGMKQVVLRACELTYRDLYFGKNQKTGKKTITNNHLCEKTSISKKFRSGFWLTKYNIFSVARVLPRLNGSTQFYYSYRLRVWKLKIYFCWFHNSQIFTHKFKCCAGFSRGTAAPF